MSTAAVLCMLSCRTPLELACSRQIGAFFTSIPNCVLGGMTTFLFANVGRVKTTVR